MVKSTYKITTEDDMSAMIYEDHLEVTDSFWMDPILSKNGRKLIT